MKISEIITDKYKLRIPPTVYYDLLADVQEAEEEQKPKTGHWIEHEQNAIAHIECSECSSWFLRPHLLRNSYCPNCGARMIDSQESETWNGIHAQITAPKGTFDKIWEEAESEEKG